mmetsp:Transcript_25434/g.54714  ORF Transcript_25434/g.54714 Transcript_25434/m.54714 type:complete len:202 (+) Transcript_25434:159-764(+)
MEGLGGRDSKGRGLISSRMLLLEVAWPSATPSPTGLWRTLLITLPSTRFPTILCMPRDTPPLVMPRTPSPSQKMAPPNSLTSSSRETRHHGWTMHPSVRDDSLASRTRMDPPRPNAVSTLPEPNRLSIAICGRRARSRTLHPARKHWRSLREIRRPLLLFMLHGVNSAREWRMNLPSMLRVLVSPFTSSVVMRNVNLCRSF